MKFHIITFGCQMNYADSARIKAVMINCWFQYSSNIDNADIIIFDTCSVRQKSEDKITGKLKEIPKDKKIRITGCMIQHNLRNAKINKQTQNKKITWLMKTWNFLWNIQTLNPEIIGLQNTDFTNPKKTSHQRHTTHQTLFLNHAFNPMFINIQQKFPNLELFFRIDDLWFLPIILPKLGYHISQNIDQEITNEYAKIIPDNTLTEDPSTAYIPISTGCNQFCSFCIVPYARGLEKYFSVEQIIKEAQTHLNNWAKEIILLWQIVNKHPEFVTIIKEVLKLKWLKWLRYTSPYPSYYTAELFELHEKEEKLCPHIHIPLQSWSTPILKKMFRGYNAEEFLQFIDKIKWLQRKISITTDIIVGFSDETEQDFQESINITQYAKFDMIYIGIYSPRKGTYAEQKLQDNIDYKTKHQRREQLNTLLNEISTQNNQEELWTTQEILIDKIFPKNGTTIYQWHTNTMKTVECIQTHDTNSKPQIGEFIKTKIIKTQSLKLFGEI